ncbi:MAG TPA: o-succinylbenzoate synthase [Thermoplasmata archaeon]|nr:o-succinylbenzoate synthase [Thermoplasmata archaeon]
MGAHLSSVRVDEVELPLVEPFETSFGVEKNRRFLLVHVESRDGLEGWGECAAAIDPLYSSESVATARWMLAERFVPILFRLSEPTPEAFVRSTARFRGNRMAKAAVELALHDLQARMARRSLAHHLGGRRTAVRVGVSVGIQSTVPRLVRRVGQYLEDGYGRIKLKVAPGWDAAPVGAVRREFPDVELWVDANQAYPSRSAKAIRAWAERNEVAQVEQPFAERAIRAHSDLARGASFRVCLDESVVDSASLEDALSARAVTSLNVKVARVGGIGVGLALARRARRDRVPSWVGGMLESGIGRAHNVALASTPPFVLSSDLSASDRYYEEDLTDPPFVLGPGSTLSVPRGPGIGVEVVERMLRKHRRASKTYRA